MFKKLVNHSNHSAPETNFVGQGSSNHQQTHIYGSSNYVFSGEICEKQLFGIIASIKNIIYGGGDFSTRGGVVLAPAFPSPSQASLRMVSENLKSMISCITSQRMTYESNSSLFDHLSTEKFCDVVSSWTKHCYENQDVQHYLDNLVEQELNLCELLSSQNNQKLLIQKHLLHPLLRLLDVCSLQLNSDSCKNSCLEEKLILILHQLCIGISPNSDVLDLFFDYSTDSDDKFPVFNLLIPFVHREGVLGQQARDALLLIMSISAKHEKIGFFIANTSNFCPVLATGLSGLYSSLPCKLEYPSDDWHFLSDDDVTNMPDLKMFLNSLEFCSAVTQVSHPAICKRLLDFVADGFLHPVIGPALNQCDREFILVMCDDDDLSLSTIEEVVAATAYLDLFIRKITEGSLLRIFVDFILSGKVDGVSILDLLVTRISSQLTRLCVVTLGLLRSLIELNCEDVMFHLVFKHLVPGRHIMLSQQWAIKELDYYASDASKFLSMIPKYCNFHQNNEEIATVESETENEDKSTPKFGKFSFKTKKSNFGIPAAFSPLLKKSRLSKVETVAPASPSASPSPSSSLSSIGDSSYEEYLSWARHTITTCKEACNNWTYTYDTTYHQMDVNNDAPLQAVDASDDVGRRESSSDARNDSGAVVIPSELVSFAASIVDESSLGFDDGLNLCKSSVEKESVVAMECIDGFVTRLNGVDVQFDVGKPNFPDVLNEIDELYEQLKVEPACTTSTTAADLSLVTNKRFDEKDILTFLSTKSDRPTLGPFLEAIIDRVERIVQSTLYVNLQLTSLIARLCCYPHPILRSLLLSHTLVFQPSIKSLIQVLNIVKNRLEEYLGRLPDREASLSQAQQFLVYRTNPDLSKKPLSSTPTGVSKKRSTGSFDFFRPRRLIMNDSSVQYSHRVAGSNGSNSSSSEEERKSVERKNAIYAALIFKEFLKELAAISQEHVVIHLS